jgi:archaemetzincin
VRISLRPLGGVPGGVLEDLTEDLRDLGAATILDPIPLVAEARDAERGQYRAEPLLDALAAGPGDRVLGVTAADLTTGTYSFIFGLARIQGRPAVISLARLSTPDRSRLRDRVAKEGIHEIGHTLGADNCPNRGCVMSFSDSADAVDRKTRAFCGRCRPTIEFSLKRLRT